MNNNFIRQINTKAKKNVIAKGNEILDLIRIPTGSLALDVELGGGIPVGRISYFIGEWSAGKTTVALKIAAMFQLLWPDNDIVWIDAEGVWDPKWAHALGLDPDKVYVVRPDYAEQAYDIALKAIDDSPGCLVIIDSVAALSAKEEMEKPMDEVTVAAMARVNTRFLRKMGSSFADEGVLPPTLILLNQYRTNVGGYGSPLSEPGGQALSFFPSVKVILKKGELYDGKKTYKTVGVDDEGVRVKAQAIKFYTEKNKTAPPKRRGHFWFYFDTLDARRSKGTYDRLEEIIRYVKIYNIVRQRSSMYDLPNPGTGEVRTFKGFDAVAAYIRDNEDVQQWIEELVHKKVLEDMTGEIQEETVVNIQEERPVHLRIINPDDEEEGTEGSEAI